MNLPWVGISSLLRCSGVNGFNEVGRVMAANQGGTAWAFNALVPDIMGEGVFCCEIDDGNQGMVW